MIKPPSKKIFTVHHFENVLTNKCLPCILFVKAIIIFGCLMFGRSARLRPVMKTTVRRHDRGRKDSEA